MLTCGHLYNSCCDLAAAMVTTVTTSTTAPVLTPCRATVMSPVSALPRFSNGRLKGHSDHIGRKRSRSKWQWSCAAAREGREMELGGGGILSQEAGQE